MEHTLWILMVFDLNGTPCTPSPDPNTPVNRYTLNPYPRIHAMCRCTSSRHRSSASPPSVFRKQSSRAAFVSGHAQHLWNARETQVRSATALNPTSVLMLMQPREGDGKEDGSYGQGRTYGFSPFGFSGFCFGSVGSNGFCCFSGAGAPPHHELI